MLYLCIYLGCGAAVYFLTWLLFRKTGVNVAGLHLTWTWGANRSGDLLAMVCAVFLWPLSLLGCLLWWLGDFQHVKDQERKAKEKASEPWYESLTTDELIARQKKAMQEAHATQPKDPNAA